MSSRSKRKGKIKYMNIDRYFWRSIAWNSLSPIEQMGYLHMKWRYDGFNNGRIGYSCRDLADRLGTSKMTALRCLRRLEQRGFIRLAKASGFNVKSRMATEWRLTEYPCDVTGELPTKEFMSWRPEEKNTVSPEGHTVTPEGQSAPKRSANNV